MLNNDFEVVLNLTKEEFFKRLMPHLYFQNDIEIDLEELKKKKYEAKLQFDKFKLRIIRSNIYTSKTRFAESIIGEIEVLGDYKISITGEVKTNFLFEIWIGIILFMSILFSPNEEAIYFLLIFLIGSLSLTYCGIQSAKGRFILFLKSLEK